jgi:putative RecB family exonuclease
MATSAVAEQESVAPTVPPIPFNNMSPTLVEVPARSEPFGGGAGTSSPVVVEEGTSETAADAKKSNEEADLLHPSQFMVREDGESKMRIPLPSALSPSSIREFQSCPQSFLFQYIFKLKQPTNAALAKGSMCHAALERVFDLAAADRTLCTLQNLFRAVWSEHRNRDPYLGLFVAAAAAGADVVVRDLERESEWGREALHLLENYWRAEDPGAVSRPNPVQREVWVAAKLPANPKNARNADDDAEVIAGGDDKRGEENVVNEDTFLVRGIVDRLDMVQDSTDKRDICLRLIDYKTGKAPHLKYSPECNERIRQEAFEQLLIYALLMDQRRRSGKQETTLPLRYLRLFYLTSVDDQAVCWDRDLGATEQERQAVLDRTHESVAGVWRDICEMVATRDPAAFPGCERKFCYCHQCRTKFLPGTVWEPAGTEVH